MKTTSCEEKSPDYYFLFPQEKPIMIGCCDSEFDSNVQKGSQLINKGNLYFWFTANLEQRNEVRHVLESNRTNGTNNMEKADWRLGGTYKK